ncbi:unnamed protein product [Ectocarpus sp. CCAP 1310/34]|nr:unnamed protein product [Ectocarpus sp. CCAP 1310/34]
MFVCADERVPAPVSDGGSVEQPGALIPYEGPYGKWGRFVKELRDNTDQIPLGFVTGQCAIIFRGKGTGITKVEKVAYDKRIDVFFQPKAWADSDFCMQLLERSFRPSRMVDGKVPEEQSLLLADNLHGQTTEEFRKNLHKECNTLLWHLLAGCTDAVQPIDAGYGRRLNVAVGVQLNKWLESGDNL